MTPTLRPQRPRRRVPVTGVTGVMAALACVLAVPAGAQDIPDLACHFDQACTSQTDCQPADVTVRLTGASGGEATLTVTGIGDRPAVYAYGGGMLSVTAKPAEGMGLWSLSLPDWPASEEAAFAEIWAVEGRISAWAGSCSLAGPAE